MLDLLQPHFKAILYPGTSLILCAEAVARAATWAQESGRAMQPRAVRAENENDRKAYPSKSAGIGLTETVF
ncbi:MAG: hypothetical protein CMN76_12485 [Spirochaetaceae bacterium]|nr:hypothetical protein [Spirochaetaceae bacterium]